MRIVSLQAENVKRLSAVEITPTGALVEITGKNRAGKTSLLDAIWWGLAGKGVVQSNPIRRGEEHAEIKLDLGTLKVRRTFNAQEDGSFTTAVTVENGDGAVFKKPQDMLDALVGKTTFDPIKFLTDMSDKEQVETLQSFVKGVDFVALAGADTKDKEARKEINRKARELRAQAAAFDVPDVAPEPVDEMAIMRELRDAGATNADINAQAAGRQQAERSIVAMQTEAQQAYERADALRQEIKRLEDKADELVERAQSKTTELRALPPLPALVDTADLTVKLEAARAASAIIARIGAKTAIEEEAARLEAQSNALTQAMKTRQEQREQAVAKADMPVPGLAFDGDQVTLNGLPFDQASHAEQLRASIAIAAAMNPRLRIARVTDGSKLDSEGMAMLAEFAAEKDLQVWIETVEQSRPSAIVIEDGRVAGAHQTHLHAAE